VHVSSVTQTLGEERTDIRVAAALSLSQTILEKSRTATRTEAAHHGLYSLDGSSSGIAISDSAFMELIHYRKFDLSPQHDFDFSIQRDYESIVLSFLEYMAF
jgi:hypothetical protein